MSEKAHTLSGTGFLHVQTLKGMRTTNEIEHIHMGPPEEGQTPMEDYALQYLILGCWRGAAAFESFPIKIDHIEDNVDEDGTIQSFTIVTASGLRFTTYVTYEGPPPTPNTKEENIEFRKDWDERVERGKS